MPAAVALPLVLPVEDTLFVRPWPDPVIDALGHDPRSAYVERFWLGILGPSATWLLRALARELEASPAGFPLAFEDVARSLGLSGRGGRHSPFVRALIRCCQFHAAQPAGPGTLAVRRKLPPLTRTQVAKLPRPLQEAHREWQEEAARRPDADHLRQRGRRLALSLFELGEDVEATERQLLRWRFPPVLAREATAWAWNRHRAAGPHHLVDAGAAEEEGGAPPAA